MPKLLTLKVVREQFALPNWTIDLIKNTTLNPVEEPLITDYILHQLESENPVTRYVASFFIIEFRLEAAKQKLIARILGPDTVNYNGTMTHALSHLNCSDELVNIFRILITQSFESQLAAYSILSEQEFDFSEADLKQMTSLWQEYLSRPEAHSTKEREKTDMVRDVYEGFMAYR